MLAAQERIRAGRPDVRRRYSNEGWRRWKHCELTGRSLRRRRRTNCKEGRLSGGGRDRVGSDASGATSRSPRGAKDARSTSLRDGGIPIEDGEVAPPYNLSGTEWKIGPKRMRREKALAPGPLADLRGRLQEGVSNDKSHLEGRKLCLPNPISRMLRGINGVCHLSDHGSRAIYDRADSKYLAPIVHADTRGGSTPT